MNPEPFFPNPPQRPEKFPEDYDFEDCLSCGLQYGAHSTKDLIQCALNELRGGKTD